MAGTIAAKLYELLRSIGVDVSQQQASNVKKLAPKNKSTATKVGLLAAERDTGGNFATVLDIFKKETDRTKQATGGRVRAASGGLADILKL